MKCGVARLPRRGASRVRRRWIEEMTPEPKEVEVVNCSGSHVAMFPCRRPFTHLWGTPLIRRAIRLFSTILLLIAEAGSAQQPLERELQVAYAKLEEAVRQRDANGVMAMFDSDYSLK